MLVGWWMCRKDEALPAHSHGEMTRLAVEEAVKLSGWWAPAAQAAAAGGGRCEGDPVSD